MSLKYEPASEPLHIYVKIIMVWSETIRIFVRFLKGEWNGVADGGVGHPHDSFSVWGDEPVRGGQAVFWGTVPMGRKPCRSGSDEGSYLRLIDLYITQL